MDELLHSRVKQLQEISDRLFQITQMKGGQDAMLLALNGLLNEVHAMILAAVEEYNAF